MDENDEEPLLAFRNYQRSRPPRPGSAPSRDWEARSEQRASEQVQRQRERGHPPRGRDRGLSRAEIVRAAIAVADAEGPEAISMRRIAREVRAGAMSLYWYVGSKEELLDLVLESLMAEVGVPEPTGAWRADLTELARRQRTVLLRHQWAMDFMGARPPSGAADVRNFERMLGLLDDLGLDIADSVNILMTVVTYVLGAVLREVQEIRGDQIRAEREATMTSEEIEAEQSRLHEWFNSTSGYPRVRRMVEADVDPDSPDTRDARFEFGLECLLAGIATHVPARE